MSKWDDYYQLNKDLYADGKDKLETYTDSSVPNGCGCKICVAAKAAGKTPPYADGKTVAFPAAFKTGKATSGFMQVLGGMKPSLTGGLKADKGKLKMELLDPYAQEGTASVLTFGANKYGDRNWEKGIEWSRIVGSIKRHLNAIEKGELIDPESGLLHVDHLGCNIMFLQRFSRTHKELNDLPAYTSGSTASGASAESVGAPKGAAQVTIDKSLFPVVQYAPTQKQYDWGSNTWQGDMEPATQAPPPLGQTQDQ